MHFSLVPSAVKNHSMTPIFGLPIISSYYKIELLVTTEALHDNFTCKIVVQIDLSHKN